MPFSVCCPPSSASHSLSVHQKLFIFSYFIMIFMAIFRWCQIEIIWIGQHIKPFGIIKYLMVHGHGKVFSIQSCAAIHLLFFHSLIIDSDDCAFKVMTWPDSLMNEYFFFFCYMSTGHQSSPYNTIYTYFSIRL